MIVPVPITVSLPVSIVVVPQDGTQVVVPINITSTSETALVSVSGLPTGLQEKYAASDTNPSGSLAFTASAATPAGTYTPKVTVQSAGQTASTNFTLVVSAAKTENTTGVFANDAGRPRWQETTLQRRPEVRHNRSQLACSTREAQAACRFNCLALCANTCRLILAIFLKRRSVPPLSRSKPRLFRQRLRQSPFRS
jgi:hypothetical protein